MAGRKRARAWRPGKGTNRVFGGWAALVLPLVAAATVFGITTLADRQLERSHREAGRPVERRDVILPEGKIAGALFGDYVGPEVVPIGSQGTSQIARTGWMANSHASQTAPAGIELMVGTYMRRFFVPRVSIQPGDICVSHAPVEFADNSRIPVRLDCDGVMFAKAIAERTPLSVKVEVPDGVTWAIYRMDHGGAAARFWFPQPVSEGYPAAGNYGGLWNSERRIQLSLLLKLVFSALAGGLLFALLRGSVLRIIWTCFALWACLLSAEVVGTPPYHSPDENMHAMGMVRNFLDEPARNQVEAHFFDVASAVQFKETYQQSSRPILPGVRGERWLIFDDWVVNPYMRSGVYAAFMKPLFTAAIHLEAAFRDSISGDPLLYLRWMMVAGLIFVAGLGVYFHLRLGRPWSAWAILISLSMPAVLSSLVTVWNYGYATVIGVLFVVGVLPEGTKKAGNKSLYLSAALLPLVIDSARSQLHWCVFGPCLLAFGGVWQRSSTRNDQNAAIKILLLTCFFTVVLWAILGEAFVPDRSFLIAGLDVVRGRVSGLAPVMDFLRSNSGLTLVLTVAASGLAGWGLGLVWEWLVSGAFASRAGSWLLRYRVGIAVFLCVFFVAAYVSIALWYPDPRYVPSLVWRSPMPSYLGHLKEIVASLASQAFVRTQDYFFVQTFVMAYGWLEATGHWFVYFAARYLFLTVLVVLIWNSVMVPRRAIGLFAPMWVLGLMYALVIIWGGYSGKFTVVGRFFFPGNALVAGPMVLALGETGEIISRRFSGHGAFSVSQAGVLFLFVVMAAASAYGIWFVMPLRFTVGLG